MRRYETLFIVDTDLSEEDRDSVTEKFGSIITEHGGTVIQLENIGQKRLAYPIKKKERGYYILLTYFGAGKLVSEIERLMRIDERVIKFITVLLEKEAQADSLQADDTHQESDVAASGSDDESSDDESSDDASSDGTEDSADEEEQLSSDDNDEETETEAEAKPENSSIEETDYNKER